MPGIPTPQQPPPTTTTSSKEPPSVPIPPAKPFHSTLRYPTSRKTLYDRNLNRTQTSPTSLASFAYLFNTIITYHHSRSGSVSEIETRLNRAGYPIGIKLLDLLLYRQLRTATRPTRILDLLQFIHTTLWRALFGRSADALEQGVSNKNEYMIFDNEPVVNTYLSVPREMSQLNPAAFVAGVLEGVCDAAGFEMEGVTAHWANASGSGASGAGGAAGAEEGKEGKGEEEMWPGRTVFLLRFGEVAMRREEGFKAGGG